MIQPLALLTHIAAAGVPQVAAGNLAAQRKKITRQEGLERKRQTRIRRERTKRKANFIMPPPGSTRSG